MAAHDQRKAQKQQARVGPGLDAGKTSRVSKAAGNLGSESMRVEQRSKTPATKQRSHNPARRSQGSKQGPRKGGSVPADLERLQFGIQYQHLALLMGSFSHSLVGELTCLSSV